MTALLSVPLGLLAALGRRGPQGFAVSIFLGLALPGLASTMRPILPVCIFFFVTLAFARADFGGVRRVLNRPARLAIAFAWITFGMPAMIEAGLLMIGRDAVGPGLLLGITLVAAAPPLMGFPVYAALLGLDNSLGIMLLVLTLVASPLVAPPLADFIAGAAVPIDPLQLGLRLLYLLAGSGAACLALRRLAGPSRLASWKNELDGLNVVIYFVFAIAAMDGVIAAAFSTPMKVLGYLLLGTGLAALGFAATQITMRRFGKGESFVLGLGCGMRNTGLLVAAMGSACPPDTYLFFSLLQFPIYCAPLLVAPLARVMVPKTQRATV
jgi:BASS family bile acid:Na+ symporter